MKKTRKRFRGGCGTALKTIVMLCALIGMSGRAWGTNYGFTDDNGQADEAAKIAFYSAVSASPVDGDNYIGFVGLPAGFTIPMLSTVTLTNVMAPVGTIAFANSSSTLALSGNVHITAAFSGYGVINGGGYAMLLDNDITLPAASYTLSTGNLTIDGQGHTLTFNASTEFALGGRTLTLKNMIIKDLDDGNQFSGTGTLVLQNCIIDVASGKNFIYDNANLTIIDDVLVQGGGTFTFGGTGAMTINAFSTLSIDHDTTFDYACSANDKLTLFDGTSTIHINGGTLKADPGVATSGLNLKVLC